MKLQETHSGRPAEKPRNGAESKEGAEMKDAWVEKMIHEYATYLNEGNSGVVYRLNIAEIPQEMRAALTADEGKETPPDQAIKILKVYSAGEGKREFEMQQRAYDIASQKRDDPRFAQVPKPYLFKDIAISPETSDFLSARANGFRSTGRAEVLVMDYIPGADVATNLYREVIRRHPKTRHLAHAADELPFAQLEQEAALALDFRRPGGKGQSEGERINERLRLEFENKDKLLRFLEKKTDLQVDPAVPEQLANTIRLFHENGLTVRDFHPRNAMVVGRFAAQKGGPETAAAPQTFIIDFANAVEIETGLDDRAVVDRYIKTGDTIEGVNFVDPRTVINDLKKLAVAPAERQRAEDADLQEKLEQRRAKLDKSLASRPSRQVDAYEIKLKATLSSGRATADQMFVLLSTNPLGSDQRERLDNLLVNLMRITDAAPELKPAAAEALARLLDKTVPAEKVRLTAYLESLRRP